jgi:phosphatidylserine/phosphatidylglycerophosphate/cardiolipin synthase-like enzyme
MKLIIQPEDGPGAILSAIKKAKKSVEIAIFRFDRRDIEKALKAAVANGVNATALVADTNRGGERNLRHLETRFLEAGITVARTANDLVRYHDKLIIIDRRIFFMLSFNFTCMDIDHSRGFGIITKNAGLVQEAVQLFEADCARRPYAADRANFVVSPANSRKVLRGFLKRAKKELLIYDPQISDKEMIRILQERQKAGVEIRMIGKITGSSGRAVKKLTRMRLHARAIIRDGHQAFIGSQSLRSMELDSRRELGLIVREPKIIKKLAATFNSDWNASNATLATAKKNCKPVQLGKKDAETALAALVEDLHPVAKTVATAVKKAAAQNGGEMLPGKMVKSTVKRVVKRAVKEAVKQVEQSLEESKK